MSGKPSKILLTALSSLLVISLCPAAAFAANSDTQQIPQSHLQELSVSNQYQNITYTVYGNEVTVTGYKGSPSTITIPSQIDGMKVTRISEYAFYECSSLVSIDIPEGVRLIGANAFDGCTSLETVNTPSTLIAIGSYAFNECTSLKSISIPNGVESIGNNTFYKCRSLESIEIPSTVSEIGPSAFCACNSLSSVTFADGSALKTIGYYSFGQCTSLTSIEIPDTVVIVGEGAFSWCESLSTVKFDDGSMLKTIASYAFNGCSSLSSIEFPEGINTIESHAFKGCSSLKTVKVPKSANVSQYAFGDSTTVVVGDGGTVWSRLAGQTRYDTMAAISEAGANDGTASTILLVSGEGFADALSASGLSGVLDAPVITTASSQLSPQASREIKRLSNGSTTVYVLGGAAAISSSIDDEVRSIDGVNEVVRLAGTTRNDTAMKIFDAGATGWGSTAIVVDAFGFADALSIAPYAAYTNSPVFGTTGDGQALSNDEAEAIKTGGFHKVLVIGGDASVDYEGVKSQLGDGFSYTRLYGHTRYDTSTVVAKWVTGEAIQGAEFSPERPLSFDNMAVSVGFNFPDALASVDLLGKTGSVLLLVPGSSQPDTSATTSIVDSVVAPNKDEISKAYVLGGETVISSSAMDSFIKSTN